MNKAQLPECGLSRKSAVLLAIFSPLCLTFQRRVINPCQPS